MSERLDHDDVMEMAVELACGYMRAGREPRADVEDQLVDYYRQIRRAELRLERESWASAPEEEEEEEEALHGAS